MPTNILSPLHLFPHIFFELIHGQISQIAIVGPVTYPVSIGVFEAGTVDHLSIPDDLGEQAFLAFRLLHQVHVVLPVNLFSFVAEVEALELSAASPGVVISAEVAVKRQSKSVRWVCHRIQDHLAWRRPFSGLQAPALEELPELAVPRIERELFPQNACVHIPQPRIFADLLSTIQVIFKTNRPLR